MNASDLNIDQKIKGFLKKTIPYNTLSVNEIEIFLINKNVILSFVSKTESIIFKKLFFSNLQKAFPETKIEIVLANDQKTSEFIGVPSLVTKENHNYQTFDNFLLTDANKVALAAAKAVCRNTEANWNPLFIYGETGVGKTHLLHSIWDKIENKKILFYQTKNFLNDFIGCSQQKLHQKIQLLKEQILAHEVFIMDDVQFLNNKTSTCDFLFEIINDFLTNKKQIIISSDTPPSSLNLPSRIISRLEAGLVVSIQHLDKESCIVIFKEMLNKNNLYKYFDNEMIEKIVSQIGSNARGILGAINQIKFLIEQNQSLPDDKLIEKIKFEIIKTKTLWVNNDNPMKEKIIFVLEKEFNFSILDLKQKRRNKKLTLTRHLFFYLLLKKTSFSVLTIATMLNRTINDVNYGVKKITDILNNPKDKQLNFLIKKLIEKLNN